MRSATARVLNADFGVQRQGQLESLKRLGQFAKYLVGLAANPMRDSAPVGPLSTIGKGRIGGTQGLPGVVRRRGGLEQVTSGHGPRAVVASLQLCRLKHLSILEVAWNW